MLILVAGRKPVSKDSVSIFILMQVLLEGGSYLSIVSFIAGLIRMRVLFEGGSYSRVYGKWI